MAGFQNSVFKIAASLSTVSVGGRQVWMDAAKAVKKADEKETVKKAGVNKNMS